MWRSMVNRKIIIVDVAEDEVEVDDVEDHEVKEEEDDDVENDGVEKEEDDDVEDDHVEAQDGTHTLCEPAQSKCTSTCHKSHFIYGRSYRKNAAPSWSNLIKHSPASTITVTTPQCKHRKYTGFWLPRRKKTSAWVFAPRVSKKRRENTTYLTIFSHSETDKKLQG